jgi:hypothetical protein
MNTNILKKCIDELNAETPRLDYLRGMLETLLEMQEGLVSSVAEHRVVSPRVAGSIPAPAALDEAAVLDARARRAIEAIKLTETVE